MNSPSDASIQGSKAKAFLPVKSTASRTRRSFSLHETLNRYFALQLMGQGLRDSDIRHLCDVPKGFLRRIAGDFELAPSWLLEQTATAPEPHRGSGSSAGVWSLCYRPVMRLEAALFANDWIAANLPFEPCPDPNVLLRIYQRYQCWHWQDKQRRHPLESSACLSVLRLVHAKELSLAQCLMCERFLVHPGPESQVLASKVCPFCHSPHAQVCAFDGEHRVLQPH